MAATIPSYDVVIAGGSYAGLAAALELGPRALVVDQHEPGAIQHSACAVPLAVLRQFGVEDTVMQVYPDAYMHTRYGVTHFPLGERRAYCIFDHTALCRTLHERSGARFLRARIQGLEDNTVLTSAGPLRAGALIDASGWPAALASKRRPDMARPAQLTPAIEADIPGSGGGIHFYVDARITRTGYGWVFPAGNELRVGVGLYRRDEDLKAALRRFLARLGVEGRPARGGMIPWFERPAVIDGIFMAGDAGGHCLPLTAEGIRFALRYGAHAGQVVRRMLDGEIERGEAEQLHHAAVARRGRTRRTLRAVQRATGPTPDVAFHMLARALASRALREPFLTRYGPSLHR